MEDYQILRKAFFVTLSIQLLVFPVKFFLCFKLSLEFLTKSEILDHLYFKAETAIFDPLVHSPWEITQVSGSDPGMRAILCLPGWA